MDIYILDSNFNIAAVEDAYQSLVWNERYNSPGDFELVIPANSLSVPYIAMDNYIYIETSNKMMIVEQQQPYADADDGNSIIFRGRSLESILDRRIVWSQTSISGNVHAAIKQLITDAIINPSEEGRKISNFIFEDSTDSNVLSLTMEEAQFTGDNLLEVIQTICKQFKLGFQIILNAAKQFVFKLYAGVNRTKEQTVIPQVEFSLNNDNLFSSKLTIDKTGYKNVTLIAGEGEGVARRTQTYGSASGLSRREYFTDARDISSNAGSEEAIPDAQYNQMLIERGKQQLDEQIITQEIEAEVDTSPTAMYIFNKDYFLGDLVENVNIYGTRSVSRVVEMTMSITANEYKFYPIFENERIIA
jgi:hypothetical protein